ncbi:MAG: glycosyltransferase involved in cell wall biosynthesis [Sediminicola sp.]|jgi:glycosyltransferase involved in cell wall biosynthesis
MSLNLLLKGQFLFIKKKGFEVIVGSASGDEIPTIIEREEVRHYVFPFSRRISPILDLIAIFQLIRCIREHKFEIVHTHTPKAGLLGMIAAWICRVPIRLHTVAGLPLIESKGFKRWILVQTEKLTYHCATRVYPNSFKMMEYIQQHIYCSQTKFNVIANGSSNGIDTAYFNIHASLKAEGDRIKTNLKIPSNHKVAVFVGRITGDKGINELIAAFKYFEDLSLILVGPFEPDLDPLDDQTVVEIKQQPNIHSVGYQSDVRPYLLAADFLVFPSYREGFPNVPMQAGAMGLPCIVTDINGCNEIIEDRVNGLIIPAKNIEELKRAIKRMLADAELFKKMKGNARQKIVDRYDQKVVWEALYKEYVSLLNKYVH